MLVITGSDKLLGGNAKEVSPVLQSLTKWSARANRYDEIAGLVQEAVQQARSGRPRPVGLEVPQSVLAAMGNGSGERATAAPEREEIAPELIDRAAALLATATRPLIWAGSGVMSAGAWEQVKKLAERWRAPVVTTRSGKGALSDRHPLALGFAELRYAPLRQLVNDADVIVAVGVSQNLSKLPAKLIRIDVDLAVVSGASGVELQGDAAHVLDALLAVSKDLTPTRPNVEQEVAALNQARFDPAHQLQPQWDLMQAMRVALP
jgi:acetolactate synthase-1/2/3 large subunit